MQVQPILDALQPTRVCVAPPQVCVAPPRKRLPSDAQMTPASTAPHRTGYVYWSCGRRA